MSQTGKRSPTTPCKTESHSLIIPTTHGVKKVIVTTPIESRPKIDRNPNRRNRVKK